MVAEHALPKVDGKRGGFEPVNEHVSGLYWLPWGPFYSTLKQALNRGQRTYSGGRCDPQMCAVRVWSPRPATTNLPPGLVLVPCSSSGAPNL